MISDNPQIVEIECGEVRRLLVEYMERDCSPDMRACIDRHLQDCRHCTAIYNGAHNLVRLVGDEKTIALPVGFSQRLCERLRLGTQ